MTKQLLAPERWIERSPETGFMVGAGGASSVQRRSLTDSALISDVDATLREINQILARVKQDPNEANRNMGVLVRLVAAWLEGLDSGEIARLLGYQEDGLVKILHGKSKVQASKSTRIVKMAEVVRLLGEILRPEAVGRWFHTYVPALGSTPFDAIRRHRVDDVLRVVRGYSSPSYS